MLLQVLNIAISLGILVCYVMVVIQMFQHGKTGPGLASTLGLLVCGLGGLFAFIYGWMKAGEWRIKNIMIAWTVLLVVNIGLTVVALPAMMQQMQLQVEQQQNAGKVAAPVGP